MTLGWTPFFDPMNVFFDWGFLLAIPMAFFLAMAYKAIRIRLYRAYWRHVGMMTVQILVGMLALMVGLFVLIEYIVPRTPL